MKFAVIEDTLKNKMAYGRGKDYEDLLSMIKALTDLAINRPHYPAS